MKSKNKVAALKIVAILFAGTVLVAFFVYQTIQRVNTNQRLLINKKRAHYRESNQFKVIDYRQHIVAPGQQCATCTLLDQFCPPSYWGPNLWTTTEGTSTSSSWTTRLGTVPSSVTFSSTR